MTLNLKDSVNTLMNLHPKAKIKRKDHLIFGFVNQAKIQIEVMEYK